MAVNIYDSINQLEKDLRHTDEYLALVDAFGKVNEDEEAKELLSDFQKIQKDFLEIQQTGGEFTEEDQKRIIESSQKMQENEITRELLQAEFQLNNLLQEINETIYKPIRELYE